MRDFPQSTAGGLSLAYYPSGFLKARVTMAQGKVVEQKLWKDGESKEATVEIPGPASTAEAL